MEIHGHLIRSGYALYVFMGSVLMDMYLKCGSVKDAGKAFENILERYVMLWSAMIVENAHNGCIGEALRHIRRMQQEKNYVRPNLVTIARILPACLDLE